MNGIHGGDVYRNRVDMDFSVNVNPLGMPEPVKAALQRAVEACTRYPDLLAELSDVFALNLPQFDPFE